MALLRDATEGARRLLSACAILLVMALGAHSSTAKDEDEGGAEAYYGAIAYSPSTRSHGWAYDYFSQREADRRAIGRCQRYAEDCIVTVRFRNACGALAIGADGYGSGWGTDRKLAQSYAIQSCSRYSGGCSVIRWVCTTRF